MKEGAAFVRAIAAVALIAALASAPAWASPAQGASGLGIVVVTSHPQSLTATTTTHHAVRPLAGQPHEGVNNRHPGAGVASEAAGARTSALSCGEAFAPKSAAELRNGPGIAFGGSELPARGPAGNPPPFRGVIVYWDCISVLVDMIHSRYNEP